VTSKTNAIGSAIAARKDREKSKRNPVRTLKDMTPEEREQVLKEIESQDREKARSRAKQASGL
jgi:hypothetical protein